ncbi:MAG: hypothetical protein HYU51_05570 [Candidatus Rokubacteria bacterium]|nr:hypothetical protein [Candidatus Rokubacteria bacterium]
MRTMLTLDDDVATKLRELAHRRKLPFVDAFRTLFRPGVDPLRLNQLNDELEARGFRLQR